MLTELHQLLGAASWSFRFKGRHKDTVGTMRATLPAVPAAVRPLWIDIADTLAARAPKEVA
ncbi:hypothetical protein ABT237_36815 [Streptomyces sp. NPDC001581]|uniref:hypothetical protein n=1 Tax=Streptomyces sp. NPDC001581 TaxID=3154386 RepID=UPI0033248D38